MQASFDKVHSFELPFKRGKVGALECSDHTYLCRRPLVSVITLTYAHEAYLAKTIDSVLSQKANFEIELIIGEDCSPDGTLDIALKFQREYPDIIRVVTGKNNVGARRNGYRCGRLCRGKYVAFCEGDDYWHDPQKLQMQVEYMQSHPECGLVHTNADTVEVVSGKRTREAIPYRPELCESEDPFLQQLTGARTIWPLTVCLLKHLRDDVTRDCPEVTDQRYLMGDTQRYLECARRTRIHYMPISTATRNLLPESTTRSRSITKRARFVASSSELTLHYLEKYPVPERYDLQIRRWVHLRELEFAYRCRDWPRARSAFAALRDKRIRVPWRHQLYYYSTMNVVSHWMVKGTLSGVTSLAKARKSLPPSI